MQSVEGDYSDLDIKWPSHCVVGTEGNSLTPGLPREEDYDLVIEKGNDPLMHPYGACFHDLVESKSTGAIEWLRQQKIKTVLLGGLASDYCVKTTDLQLLKAALRVILNQAACRGVAAQISAAALVELETAGAELVDSSHDLKNA